MNIFENFLDIIKKIILDENKKNNLFLPEKLNNINVEIPPSNFDSDLSTNVAMILSKPNKKKPLEIAEYLKSILLKNEHVETISVVKPGFINIKLNKSFWNQFIREVIFNKSYGSDNKIKKIRYLIEFVSANPTGPLHVGHCRGAILGDVLSNLLTFNKHNVTREYYVNDYGNQIIHFVNSVFLRIREIKFDEKFPIDNKDLYPGNYLIDIANNIIKNNKKLKFDNFDNIKDELTEMSVAASLKIIKNNLIKLGINHNSFVSEKKIVLDKEVDNVVKKLKNKNFLYTGKIAAPARKKSDDYFERDQLLFKSTEFGDDKDRALQKSDNSWTYFASDAAYHNNKIERNFDKLINIFGSDHTGYVKRITSIVDALSGEKNKLICKVSQLVKLMKDGKPFKMSKRKGDYITIEDLINEVGKDATRFIMLNRSSDVELDFDFNKVKEKSKDNPVFYVQYCYARIASVFRNINSDIDDEIDIKDFNFKFNEHEIKIFRKISEWPKCVQISSAKLEPHRLTTYLYELASQFHSYWNLGKDDVEKRFIENNKISNDKIVILKLVANVIKSGMNIVGVDTPKKM